MAHDVGQVADHLVRWVTRPRAPEGGGAGAAHDPDIERLYGLVLDRLAADSALVQFEREAAAGVVSERTKRRLRDALGQAIDDDPVLATEVDQILERLASAGAARRHQAGFDPFGMIPIFPVRWRTRHSAWLLLPGIVMGLVVVGVTAVEGTLGSLADVHWWQDVRFAFSQSVPRTEPSFPLMRDMTSIFLFLVVMFGVVLLHKQWQFMSSALPMLRDSNVITPRRRPRSTVLSRLIGIDRLVAGSSDYEAYDRLSLRMGQPRTATKVLLWAGVLVAGFVLAMLAENGLNREMFVFLAPTGVGADEHQQWLTSARESWWAGAQHPMGQAMFALMTWFAMVLVLVCNVVGLITVYLAVALSFVAHLGADWYNQDGRYGWMPVARICRTMYLCLVLLGAGISFVITVLGSDVAFSMIGIIALYVLFLPVFTMVPWLVFRRIERQARRERLDELVRATQASGSRDPDRVQSFVEEFARCRSARINPMRLRAVPSGAFFSIVFLPILLTVLQIFAQVGLGRFGG